MNISVVSSGSLYLTTAFKSGFTVSFIDRRGSDSLSAGGAGLKC